MEPERRIAELEAQVRELSGMVQRLLEERDGGGSRPHDHHLLHDLGVRVDRAIRGHRDPNVEAHIGAVWLSRTAIVLLLGILAVGARTLVLAEALEPWQKLSVLCAVGAGLFAAGVYLWRHHDVFAEGFLGAGLGLLYLSGFSLLIPESLRLVEPTDAGSMALPTCLAAALAVAWWLRSQTIAVVAVLTGFLTACWAAPEASDYALFCCAVIAGVTFLMQFTRGWLFLSWIAVLGTHACMQIAIPRPEPLDYGSLYLLDHVPDYSPTFAAVFALCYAFLAGATLADCRQTRRYRRSAATLAGLNTLFFLRLAWPYAEDRLGPVSWAFWAVLAALWFGGAVLAERRGRERNHMFPLLLAKGVVATTLALAVYLPREWLLGAMGLEGLALAIVYKRSGVVFLKVLGLGLVLAATILGLTGVRESEITVVAGQSLPRSIVATLAMGFSFSLTAAFYERFTRWVRPEERKTSGQWFLADSMLNWRGASMAIAHAAAAAFVLIAATIFQYGDDPRMPYMLAGQGLGFAVLGLILLTPQLEVGCVFLLMAAHLCYHVFLWLPIPGFEEQLHYLPLTLALALFTYLGAYLWERYVRLFHAIGPEWEHHLLVTAPYLAATIMLAVLLWRGLEPVYVPASLAGLAMALLAAGWLTGFPGIKGSGVLAVAVGSGALLYGLRGDTGSLSSDPRFPLQLTVYLIACLGSERLVALTQRLSGAPSTGEDHVRSLLIAVPVALGAYGIVMFSPHQYTVYYLIGHGFAALTFGLLFREVRYRWGAMLIFAFVIAWGTTQLAALSPAYQAAVFGLSAVILTVVLWILTRLFGRERRTGNRTTTAPIAHDG